MNLAGRIGRAILWGQAGRLMEAAILFFFSLSLARILGPESFGIYAMGLSLAGACGFLSLLGLGPETLGRFLPEIVSSGGPSRARELLRALLTIRVAAIVTVASAIFAMRHTIAQRLHFPMLAASLAGVLLVFGLRSILDLLTYFCSGLLDLRRVALAKLSAAAVAPGLFAVLLTFHQGGVNAAWLSIATGSACAILILASPLLSTRTAAAVHEPFPLRRILAFGLFTWATNFFVYVLGDSTDVLLLGWLAPDRAAVGLYAVGARVVFSLTSLLLGWTSLVGMASFSASYQRAGIPGLTRAVESVWKLGALCLVPPLLFICRFARPVITVVFSGAYASAGKITEVLAILAACGALCGFSIHGGILYVLNRERLACCLVGFSAAFNITAEIVLVRKCGVEGAAWATGLSLVLLAALCLMASGRYAPLRLPVGFLSKIVAAAGAALFATGWLRPESAAQLAGVAGVYAVVFFASLALLKPLNASDSASLHRINSMLGCYAERFFTAAYAGSASGDH
jgi:lipopolysaccharide exporter